MSSVGGHLVAHRTRQQRCHQWSLMGESVPIVCRLGGLRSCPMAAANLFRQTDRQLFAGRAILPELVETTGCLTCQHTSAGCKQMALKLQQRFKSGQPLLSAADLRAIWWRWRHRHGCGCHLCMLLQIDVPRRWQNPTIVPGHGCQQPDCPCLQRCCTETTQRRTEWHQAKACWSHEGGLPAVHEVTNAITTCAAVATIAATLLSL